MFRAWRPIMAPAMLLRHPRRQWRSLPLEADAPAEGGEACVARRVSRGAPVESGAERQQKVGHSHFGPDERLGSADTPRVTPCAKRRDASLSRRTSGSEVDESRSRLRAAESRFEEEFRPGILVGRAHVRQRETGGERHLQRRANVKPIERQHAALRLRIGPLRERRPGN